MTEVKEKIKVERLATVERLALTVEEAAAAIGVSRPTLQREIDKGGFPCVEFGNRKIIPVGALRAWLEEKAEQSIRRTTSAY